MDLILAYLFLLFHQRFLITKLSLISCGGFLELIRAFFELGQMVVEALLGGGGLGLALLQLTQALLL